jgi:hypothetical protein
MRAATSSNGMSTKMTEGSCRGSDSNQQRACEPLSLPYMLRNSRRTGAKLEDSRARRSFNANNTGTSMNFSPAFRGLDATAVKPAGPFWMTTSSFAPPLSSLNTRRTMKFGKRNQHGSRNTMRQTPAHEGLSNPSSLARWPTCKTQRRRQAQQRSAWFPIENGSTGKN